MIKYICENLSVPISVASLIVALFTLKLNRKNAKHNSYNQTACCHVFFMRRRLFARVINKYDFDIKIHNSISSKVIPFDYSLIVRPYIGGIYRMQLFSTFDNKNSLGINKTGPVILSSKPKRNLYKKYASDSEWHFSSTPLFPYFSAYGKVYENSKSYDKQLNRYHFYLEVTDFCKNTEIWYISFSLLLSDIKESEKKWEKYIFDKEYKYYTFADINIVSPRDIPKNLARVSDFSKTLEEIEGRQENSLNSTVLMQKGFDKLNYDLQLFEMKEYITFFKKLKAEKFI